MAIISPPPMARTGEPPLAQFALAWRWQHNGRHPLPAEALARLQALGTAQAKTVFGISSALLQGRDGHQGLDSNRFAVSHCDAAARDATDVTAWLHRQGLAGRTRIWLSWEPELALCTRWEVFARHWQAFCYPGSDDVVVFPASQRWALFHHHAQRLEFGRLQQADSTRSRAKHQKSFRPA